MPPWKGSVGQQPDKTGTRKTKMIRVPRILKQVATGLALATLACGLTATQAEAHHHHSFGHSFARGLGFGVGSGVGYNTIDRVFNGFGGGSYGGYGGYGGGYAMPYMAPSYTPPPPPSTNVIVVQPPAAPPPAPGYPYPIPGYTHYQPGQGYVSQTVTYVQGYGYIPSPPQPMTP
ncbi:hypothetical protein AL01_08135 [Bombella intestini]|uniref:Uncharacterized protein n=2 Tax=Bombella intestini TaxID=1539051 RepID=A0A1S8GN72_9PROT|nr:hypothetical protein AL01_08135 [Bombella intestini]